MKNTAQHKLTEYYLYDDLPVKMEVTSRGGLRVSVLDPATRSFFADSTYRSRVLYDRDNLARKLSEYEFKARLCLLLKHTPFRRLPDQRMKALKLTSSG